MTSPLTSFAVYPACAGKPSILPILYFMVAGKDSLWSIPIYRRGFLTILLSLMGDQR